VEDMNFWRGVFKTYAEIMGTKPKSDKQIIEWLKSPRSDSSEYKMWGNGVALPCVWFVMAGIAWWNEI
jgi:DNA (cytosine-5)-methyltransferase 1